MVITGPSRLLPAAPTPLMLKAKHSHKVQCAGHLERGLEPDLRAITLANILRVLRHHDFDAIAFQGLSGALFAPMVAFALDKTLLAVRKGEDCHSCRQVEGDYAAKRYVILDDFVSCGSTVQRILTEIGDAVPMAHCIGVLEYCYIGRNTDPHDCIRPVDKYDTRGRTGQPSPWTELTMRKNEAPTIEQALQRDMMAQVNSLADPAGLVSGEIQTPFITSDDMRKAVEQLRAASTTPKSLADLVNAYTTNTDAPTWNFKYTDQGPVAVDAETQQPLDEPVIMYRTIDGEAVKL